MIELFFATIPLENFDQQKLETLVRRIPEAYVRADKFESGEKRFYSYPQNTSAGFIIDCEATYYLHSTLPSDFKCSLNVNQQLDPRRDEHQITFSDPVLYRSLSYDSEVKRFYSNERVYGLGLNGSYRKLFRYGFVCDINICQLTFSTRPADNY